MSFHSILELLKKLLYHFCKLMILLETDLFAYIFNFEKRDSSDLLEFYGYVSGRHEIVQRSRVNY